jgi:forespore regulator of the sigma-K checkpoint
VPRFRILKEIKKSLKRKRRIVWSLGAGVAIFLLATLVGVWIAKWIITPNGMDQQSVSVEASIDLLEDNPVTEDMLGMSTREQVIRTLGSWEGPIELVLHRTYLCGEENRQLGRHPTTVAVQLLTAHRDWNAAFDSSGALIMEQSIDDLSLECRKSAYMAMDETGNLSLYDGLPRKEKVIQTFFQMDIERLEMRMSPDQLLELSKGIRITDKDEYNSVLSTFNEFALSKAR